MQYLEYIGATKYETPTGQLHFILPFIVHVKRTALEYIPFSSLRKPWVQQILQRHPAWLLEACVKPSKQRLIYPVLHTVPSLTDTDSAYVVLVICMSLVQMMYLLSRVDSEELSSTEESIKLCRRHSETDRQVQLKSASINPNDLYEK